MLQVCTTSATAQAFIAPLAKYLCTLGYEITIACSGEDFADARSYVQDLREAGFRIETVPIRRNIAIADDLVSIVKLYRLIRRGRFDIVHTQTSKAGFIGRVAAKLAGVPIVVHTAYDFYFRADMSAAMRAFYIVLEKLAGCFCDELLFISEAVREDAIKYSLKVPSQTVCVGMGIDLSRFPVDSMNLRELKEGFGLDFDGPVVGTIARLVPNKGIACFLKAAARVLDSWPQTRFLVVGDGPLREQLESLAEELNLVDSVVFMGFRKDPGDIPKLLAIMDVFVLPTLREGFGVVFAEAMAMAKPVVGSKIAPITEVVKGGETGILVPPDESELFAEAIISLLNDDAKRQEMGIAGRKRVEDLFDERQVFRRIEAEYQKLLLQKGIGLGGWN